MMTDDEAQRAWATDESAVHYAYDDQAKTLCLITKTLPEVRHTDQIDRTTCGSCLCRADRIANGTPPQTPLGDSLPRERIEREAQQNGRAMVEQAAAQLGVSLDPPPLADEVAALRIEIGAFGNLRERGYGAQAAEIQGSMWDRLRRIEVALTDLSALLPIGHMYLDALDADPLNEMLTLPEAIGVTAIREVVERNDPAVRDA